MSANREIEDIKKRWASVGVKIDAYVDSDRHLYLSKIVVPKEARGAGHGTNAMHDLVTVADNHHLTMTLTPATDFGGTSVERLKKFYKRFGFVENKGRNKDFSISASMYRTPVSFKKATVAEDRMRFPTINDVAAELRRINKQDSADDGDDGGIDVRLQVHPDGNWNVNWGPSDYDQDHRGYWGSSSVPGDNRRFDSKSIARDLIDQARFEHKATGGDEDDEDDDMLEEGTDDEEEEVGHIGDVNWPEFGGGPVFVDAEGEARLEYVEPPTDDVEFDDPGARWTVYRVDLDPEPPSWGDVKDVARSAGISSRELRDYFTSDDPIQRALGYETFANYYGWANFDSYPLHLTCEQMNERYDADLDCGEDEEDEED